MNATDRLALAALGEHHVKRSMASSGTFSEGGWGDIGASLLPGVGTVYNGAKAVKNFSQGEWGKGLMNAGMAGLGLLPGGGIAGKGMMKFFPKVLGKTVGNPIGKGIGYLQQQRNLVGTNLLGRSQVGQKVLNSPKIQNGLWGAYGGAQVANSLRSQDEGSKPPTADGGMNVSDMMGMARSHVMSNPIYAQPGFSPNPNYAGL